MRLAWAMWILSTMFFFTHYFVRVAPAVMITDLLRDFHVNAVALGALASFFYIPYVTAQIPMGMLIDRYGVRLVLPICIVISAFSVMLFAQTTSIETANWSRFFFGLGAAAAFISAAKIAAAWFPPAYLALAMGLTQTSGMLGGLIGMGPSAHAMAAVGWRPTFWFFSVIFLTLALVVALFLRNKPASTTTAMHVKEAPVGWAEIRPLVMHPVTWINALFCGFIFAPMQLYAEFWGVAYLSQLNNINAMAAGTAIGTTFIGWCVGGPISGWLADRIGRVPVMRLSAIGGLLTLPCIMYCSLSYPMLLVMNFLFGLTNTGLVAGYTVAGELHSKRTAGLAMAIANMFTILIGAALNPIVGSILDTLWKKHPEIIDGVPFYAAADYTQALVVLPMCLVAGFICTFFIKETLKKS